MIGRNPRIAIGFFTGLLVCSTILVSPIFAAQSSPAFSGALIGEVKNGAGIAQMGAAVVLYNHYDRAIGQVFTDAKGSFSFNALLPDIYSLRVSLASFVPAFKRNIAVQPGLQSMLTISLASMLSSIELVSTSPSNGSIVSEDWKWVLRSAQSTRPIVRFRAGDDPVRPKYANIFSDTRGMVKVSAGDTDGFSGSSSQADLGTAFALVTSLYGSNQLQVSGNVGYSARSALPVAGIRTTYSRTGEATGGPEVTVTLRQISLPNRGGFAAMGGDAGPALRTLAISTIDEFTVRENIRVEYGLSAETVSLLDRLTTVSPYARLTYDLGRFGSFQVAYSSGDGAAELAGRTGDPGSREETELRRDLAALASMPRVSLRDGHSHVQRTNTTEIGYRKTAGSRTYGAGIYREDVQNGALTIAGADNVFAAGDVLPDLGSRSGVFDIGNFSRWGYLASVTQSVNQNLEIMVAYGRGGALTTFGHELAMNDPNELRSLVKVAEKNWAAAKISGTAPVAGTHFSASYGWADYRSLMPGHTYLTQRIRPEPGLNITIRQPLPGIGMIPGRFEASAELRNLLAQGYLPVSTSDGSVLTLTNAPRALRGGLSFIF